jgi:hypothetical protein
MTGRPVATLTDATLNRFADELGAFAGPDSTGRSTSLSV